MLIVLGKISDQYDFLILLFAHMTKKGWLTDVFYTCQVNINEVLSQKRQNYYRTKQIHTTYIYIRAYLLSACEYTCIHIYTCHSTYKFSQRADIQKLSINKHLFIFKKSNIISNILLPGEAIKKNSKSSIHMRF